MIGWVWVGMKVMVKMRVGMRVKMGAKVKINNMLYFAVFCRKACCFCFKWQS